MSGPSKKGLIDLSLGAFATFLKDSAFAESYARAGGLLQSVDPRPKLVAILILVVSTTFMVHVEWVLGVHLLTLLLAKASKIEMGFYLKRVWLFIPLFTGVIAVPAMFNLMIPGDPLLVFLKRGQAVGPLVSPWDLALTVQGVSAAFLFVLRTAAAVSLVVLLVLTTRWMDLLVALQSLKVPKAFVMILEMTYRYVFLFAGLVEEMHLARKSRSVKPEKRRQLRRWIASRMSVLLRRSLSMSEQVHFAMVSRGYNGKVRGISPFQAHAFDWSFLVFFVILSLLMLLIQNIEVI